MHHSPAFRIERRDAAGATIYDGDSLVAEIRDLRLSDARFFPGGPVVIGAEVPLPLFWWQYQQHQKPENNAGSHAELEIVKVAPSRLLLRCYSANASRAVRSRTQVELTFDAARRSYCFDIDAWLDVMPGRSWLVRHNPAHGEVEFCNFWPAGSFSRDGRSAKRYQACFVARGDRVERIPHHHLESSDKHNVTLAPGDRFGWLVEDCNPVVEILTAAPHLQAGLCAYMWDAHFGYRVCHNGENRRLANGEQFRVAFRLYALDRAAATDLTASAVERPAPEISQIPIYVAGTNTFASTIRDCAVPHDAWPWEPETEEPRAAKLRIDNTTGYDDQHSVRIEHTTPARSCWKLTALGPAYGQPPFQDGDRFRLHAMVRSAGLQGEAWLAIRLHRQGWGDLFDLATYEIFASPVRVHGDAGWQEISVTTPAISPAPDRLHLLLWQQGVGTSWFDNVLFEIER